MIIKQTRLVFRMPLSIQFHVMNTNEVYVNWVAIDNMSFIIWRLCFMFEISIWKWQLYLNDDVTRIIQRLSDYSCNFFFLSAKEMNLHTNTHVIFIRVCTDGFEQLRARESLATKTMLIMWNYTVFADGCNWSQHPYSYIYTVSDGESFATINTWLIFFASEW